VRRGVVELLLRDPDKRELDVLVSRRAQLLGTGDDLGLGRLQRLVEPADHDERQDHLAVVGLLVVAAKQLRDPPDKVRVVADVGHRCCSSGMSGILTRRKQAGHVAAARR